jgi:hypothetical protein
MIGFLLDEHIPPAIRTQLLKHNPTIRVHRIGDGIAPPLGTLDPDLLLWIEANDCWLVTFNHASMPGHLTDHLAQGRHIPGILKLGMQMAHGAIIEELLLIAGASLPDEYKDQLVYLPKLR